MSDDVLVRVENVSKRFCRSLKRSLWYGLQDLGSELGGRRHGGGKGLPRSSADVELRQDEFWAVKDVSFELRRGECLGLIGRNGAGKTTLLRMLNGLIKPDTGRIEMNGRVGALIALGAGFNPILTGRENIYTNASVLGMSDDQVRSRVDEIIDFSEIEEFIDTPVQSYSSGMQVRLGFAIATALKPDILILDEVLAVGDSGFRYKCYEAIDKLLSSTAVIFVSHNMPDVGRICTTSAYMSKGQSTLFRSAEEGVAYYHKQNTNSARGTGFIKTRAPVSMIDIGCKKYTSWNHSFSVDCILDLEGAIQDPNIIVDVFNQSGEFVGCARKTFNELGISLRKGRNMFSVTLDNIPFRNGTYMLTTHILSSREFIASHSKLTSFEVTGGKSAIAAPCYLDLTGGAKIS